MDDSLVCFQDGRYIGVYKDGKIVHTEKTIDAIADAVGRDSGYVATKFRKLGRLARGDQDMLKTFYDVLDGISGLEWKTHPWDRCAAE